MGHIVKPLWNSMSLLLACLVCSQTCLAQADPWERVDMVKQGRNVYVKLHTNQSLKGKMDLWRKDGLSLKQGRTKVVSIEKSDVAEVALLIGRSRGRKAMLAGIIAGSVSGGLTAAGYAASGACCDVSPAVVIPAAAGFWGGIAAGIAALFPQHHEVIYLAAPPSGTSSVKEPPKEAHN